MSNQKAFVPTMGALHDGHLSLIQIAKQYSSDVVLSVFVNPLQFESSADLENYPRDVEGDTLKAQAAGATEIWTPTTAEIYPDEVNPISAGVIGELYEGANRNGHFDGVLTVVDRLFKHVQPTWAIFGEKDFQQLFIIRKWVKEMKLPIEVIAAPIIRDLDGLALSSRNVQLSDQVAALVIYRALLFASKEKEINRAREVMNEVLASEESFTLDYAEIINEDNFEPAVQSDRNKRAIIAGWVNGIRLIDNMPMNGSTQ